MITGNTHFAIATHVLAALAVNEGQLLTSAELAHSVDTNAAFLRTVLGSLRQAGLIETKLGKGGGSRLGRPSDQITLLDVFRATDGDARLATHDCSGTTCAVGRKIPEVLARLNTRLDSALARELERVHIAEVAEEVRPI